MYQMNAGLVDLFDIDGTYRRPFTVGSQPGVPHPELVELLRELAKSGDPIAVTGMSPEGICRLEMAAGLSFVEIWCSYALRRRKMDKTWRNTGEPTQVAVFEQHLPFLRSVAAEYDGLIDDEEACFTAFLKPTSPEFEAAREAISKRLSEQVHEEVLQETLNSNGELTVLSTGVLRAMFNPDGGITVLPACGGKHLAVEHFQRKNRRIRIAAGDTRSDLPMLEAAEFPIATITEDGHDPHPDLVALVKRRGVGYVCTRQNGHGLEDAILAARSAGVVSF